MINIQIDESVDYRSGIYLLEFSDGHFYIGSAKYIKSRIDFHCRCILSNFKQKVVSSKALLNPANECCWDLFFLPFFFDFFIMIFLL